MTDLDQAALSAAADRGEYLLPRELVAIVERTDPAVDRGVPRERLRAYAEELSEPGAGPFDAAELDDLLDERLTDAASWAGETALYEVGDGVSRFPPRWHDDLGSEAALDRYVDVLAADLASSSAGTGTGGAGAGVPLDLLLDAASALGPHARDDARAAVERLRDEGAVEELADQHPQTRVRPAGE